MTNLDDIQISITQDFDVLPEDMYEVVISTIKEDRRKKYQSEGEETVLKIEYTILKGDYEGRKLFQTIRPKLGTGDKSGKASNLYKLWCAVEGKKFTKEDFANFHLSSLLNRVLKVVTENKESGDRTFSNVSTFLKVSADTKDTMEGLTEGLAEEKPAKAKAK